MSESDVHKRKKKKNLMLLLLVVVWCALIWAVTMAKIAQAQDKAQDKAHDIGKSYATQRKTHQEEITATEKRWTETAKKTDAARKEQIEKMSQSRARHQKSTEPNPSRWQKDWDKRLNP